MLHAQPDQGTRARTPHLLKLFNISMCPIYLQRHMFYSSIKLRINENVDLKKKKKK